MYENSSLVKKYLEIIIWSSLFLLIPLAGIGFFSEGALPGQTLYPVKRVIENIVLDFDSFDRKTKALYNVYLADRRFSETEKLLVDSPIMLDTSQIQDFTSQIQAARDTINSVEDANYRKTLREKLLQNISDYRNQLSSLQTQNTSVSISKVTPILQNQNTNPSPIPTPIPNPPSPPQNQGSQVSQLEQQLQDLQNQIQQDQTNNVKTDVGNAALMLSPTNKPIPTIIITPTPTDVPTPTNTPTPTMVPTDTPIPTQSQDYKNNGYGNNNNNGKGNSNYRPNFSGWGVYQTPVPTSNLPSASTSTGSAAQ